MQQESPATTIVRDWQEAANDQDVAHLLKLSDPDIAIAGPRGSGYGHGHQLLVDWLSRAGLSLETLRTFARGNAVVAVQHGVWRSPETGEITGEADLATRFFVDDGRVTQLARHDGPDGLDIALKEAGLDRSDEILPFSAESPFRFCPADGTRLGPPRPSGGATCPLCGRSWYRNPAPAVGAAIVEDGRALVTVRAREPYKGKIDVPGGFLELGEHPVDGLKREVMEELGVEVDVLWPPVMFAPHRYGDEGVHALAIGFRAGIISGEPKPSDDVADIRWISPEDIDSLDFAWEHDREFIREAFSGK